MEKEHLLKMDPEIYQIVQEEEKRQAEHIELIASENFTSKAVMEAMGSVLTNKYAEGLPGKRYYGGCEIVDKAEEVARNRLMKLYGADHVNVQPHSGANANMAVYLAKLQPGDTVLGMNLSHGGHLTHGSPVNISGKYFQFVDYGVDKETERIDFDQVWDQAKKHQPKLIVAGASAYPRAIDFAKFAEIAHETGALLMVDMAHIAGLVAAGLHQNPVDYADIVTTTTHKTLRGPRGGAILCKEEHGKDIDKAVFPGLQGGPLMHIIAAKAVAFHEALQDDFKLYGQKVIDNAQALAQELLDQGIVLCTGGTDNHLILMNVTSLGLTGKEAEELLGQGGLAVNKNTIPFETQSPFITSGVRIGTAAMTTRGFGEEDFKEVGKIIGGILKKSMSMEEARKKVQVLCQAHPLYQD